MCSMGKEEVGPNPVLFEYEGFEVKKYNKVTISLSETEMVKLITAHVDSGRTLSFPKILALLSKSCQTCGNDNISITIPKNILSTKRYGTGGNVTSRKNKRDEQAATYI